MRLPVCLILAAFLFGCASQKVVFLSDPPGATVTVNGERVGFTPCSLEYKDCSGSTYDVRIERQGYLPVHAAFRADEVDHEARSTWMAAGAVWSPLWLGTMFTNKLKDSYEFVLKADPPEHTVRN